MSNKLQATLDSMQTQSLELDPIWDGKQNWWTRQLASRYLSEIGERLVIAHVGGERTSDPSVGYKVKSGDSLIDVRVATLTEMGDYPALMWRRIRPADPFTHLCLVAIYPTQTRMFVVPKDMIPDSALLKIKGSPGSFQITTRRVHSLPQWLTDHEIH